MRYYFVPLFHYKWHHFEHHRGLRKRNNLTVYYYEYRVLCRQYLVIMFYRDQLRNLEFLQCQGHKQEMKYKETYHFQLAWHWF